MLAEALPPVAIISLGAIGVAADHNLGGTLASRIQMPTGLAAEAWEAQLYAKADVHHMATNKNTSRGKQWTLFFKACLQSSG
jgi:hypothetical protein